MKKFLISFFTLVVVVFFDNLSLVQAMDKDYISIIEETGDLSLFDNHFMLTYDEYNLIIPDYNYYFKFQNSAENSYYIADVFEKQSDVTQIVYFVIYYNENTNNYNNACIHIFERLKNMYFKVNFVLSNDFVDMIATFSSDFDLILSEEILKRLKYSVSYFSQIQDLCNENISNDNQQNFSTYALGDFGIEDSGGSNYGDNSSLSAGDLLNIDTEGSYNSYDVNYDNFTNYDGIIHEYENSFTGISKDENGRNTDDLITGIVPKELFFEYGNHMYIGNEYGFFIRTYVDVFNPYDFASDVVVFDIIRTIPDFENSIYSGSVKIEFLFEYKYRAVDRSVYPDSFWADYDPSLDKVVIPHIHSDMLEYHIGNYSFKHSIENETALNEDDLGYNPNNDNGAFFVQTRLNYKGIGFAKYNHNYIKDIVSFAFGKVKYSDVLCFAVNLLEPNIYSEIHESNSESNINTYATNKYYQIQNYGHLLKQLSVIPNQESEKPVIFGKGDYIENIYVVSFEEEEVPTRYTSSIYLEIGIDNTNLNVFGESGEFNIYSSGTSYYSTSKGATLVCNSETRSCLSYNGEAVYYKFKPTETGSYVFETTGTTDTKLSLYDSNSNLLFTNDDSGISLNGRINCTLTKNDTYFIKVQGSDNTDVGEFRFLVMYDIYSSLNLTSYPSAYIFLTSYGFRLVRFTPSSSGTYKFITSENTCDPVIYLFDSDFECLAYNDDGSVGYNACLTYDLESGQTYYILCKEYIDNAGEYLLTVQKE